MDGRVITIRVKGGGHADIRIDDADAEFVGSRAWFVRDGYAVTRVYMGKRDGRSAYREVCLHRLLLCLGIGDARQGDHINRNRLDNRRSNLRVCTFAENRQNVGAYKRRGADHKVSGYRGVHWNGRCWVATAKQKVLGRFQDAAEAGAVASAWRRDHFPFAVESRGICP